jgi:nicotinate-nucleotide adenylyltransferase
MKVGLFFGSFNPVHTGHLIIAQHLAENSTLDQVWLVVSPHNPLKEKNSLARDYDRLHLVHLAIEGHRKLKACSDEFTLPKPSYTVDTLAHLKEKYPQHEFALIMGGDNLATFNKWKNFEFILNNYKIFLYNRPGYDDPLGLLNHPNVQICQAPMLEISSSFIRQQLALKKSIRYLVTDEVWKYIESSGMYSNR